MSTKRGNRDDYEEVYLSTELSQYSFKMGANQHEAMHPSDDESVAHEDSVVH